MGINRNICKLILISFKMNVFCIGYIYHIIWRQKHKPFTSTLLRMARCQAQKASNLPGWPPIFQPLYWSACFVCFGVYVFPNKDQLLSEAADVSGIWRMKEATGERASDPQSPFHQVADEICWHDCHIALQDCQESCPHPGQEGETW